MKKVEHFRKNLEKSGTISQKKTSIFLMTGQKVDKHRQNIYWKKVDKRRLFFIHRKKFDKRRHFHKTCTGKK